MSEYDAFAWVPFGKMKYEPLACVLTEEDAEFIGPRTSGMYEEEALCEGCMGGFKAKVCVCKLKVMLRPRYCQECVAANEAKEAAKNKAVTREDKWASICPKTYLKTDLAQLRREGKLATVEPVKLKAGDFVDAILARPRTERGLGFVGSVRLGKTRLMFAKLREYYLAGHGVMYVYAPDFSDYYAALMSESAMRGNQYLERCIAADDWFLDDLGKGRLSEAAQRALLRVIEKRTNSERPIYVTCNSDSATLIDRMRYEDTGQESEYARPMLERLKEFCDWYKF